MGACLPLVLIGLLAPADDPEKVVPRPAEVRPRRWEADEIKRRDAELQRRFDKLLQELQEREYEERKLYDGLPAPDLAPTPRRLPAPAPLLRRLASAARVTVPC